jgi:hypothetical protein
MRLGEPSSADMREDDGSSKLKCEFAKLMVLYIVCTAFT